MLSNVSKNRFCPKLLNHVCFFPTLCFQSVVLPAPGSVSEEEEETQRAVHFLRLPQEPQLHHLQPGLGVSVQHRRGGEQHLSAQTQRMSWQLN